MDWRRGHDLAVVGAGIVGLATAWAARQRGLSVVVLERHPHCIGASVRNFGFVTVTGQSAGRSWQRARRSRDCWEQVAAQAGIDVVHTGLHVLARRPEAAALLQAFLQTEMGEGCHWLDAGRAARELPWLQPGQGVLVSPHELRVESCDAIPRLTRWLAQDGGVEFLWNTSVLGIERPRIHTSRGAVRAERVVVCPGHELRTLYPQAIEQAGINVCTLQMMRVVPRTPLRLCAAVLSDLSLLRYGGFAALPQAAALQAALTAQQPDQLRWGVHLIAVQSGDGSLVVGDSHVYGQTEAPFSRGDIDDLILNELHQVLRCGDLSVRERWTGSYASAAEAVYLHSPEPGVALGIVTSGTGASIAFALAEELLDLSEDAGCHLGG